MFSNEKTKKDTIDKIAEEFKDSIFGINKTNLAEVVGLELLNKGHTISVAESCTGGKIAHWMTSVPGASRYFNEAVVVYSNQAKQRYCNVLSSTLETYGAVSQQTAIELAEGMRTSSAADWAIAVTGIAGPGGGTEDKPVGTVHIACAGPQRTKHAQFLLYGTRDQITESTSAHALFMLYKEIKNTD